VGSNPASPTHSSPVGGLSDEAASHHRTDRRDCSEQRVRELNAGAPSKGVDPQQLLDLIEQVEQVAKERFPEQYAANWPGR
jgi:hypothetical protein